MEQYKIPYQNLTLNRPSDNELVRWNGDNGIKYFALRKGNKLYQSAINPNGDLKDEASFRSRYGIDYGSLPTASGSLGDWVSTGLEQVGWDPSVMSGWSSPTTTGGTVTKTIDPSNPNRAIDVMGNVSDNAPADYLKNLLGSGQGVGGSYNNTPSQAKALYPNLQNEVASRAGEQRSLVDIASSRPDVLNTAKAQGGDPFTAGTAANRWLNDWWNSRGGIEYPGVTPRAGEQRSLVDIASSRPDVLNMAKAQGGDPFLSGTKANAWLNDWWNQRGSIEFPGVSLSQPSNAHPGGDIDPKDAIIKQLVDANKALQGSSGTLESTYKGLLESSGYNADRNKVGTFDEEIQKTQSLLTDLENQVMRGQAVEENRLAPMDIIGLRKSAVASAVEPTRQGLLKTLSIGQTGRSQLLETLQTKKADILTQLGLQEKDLDRNKLSTSTVGSAETGYYLVVSDKDGNVVKSTEMIKGTGGETWGQPFKQGDKWVIRNNKGDIKAFSNVANPTSSDTKSTELVNIQNTIMGSRGTDGYADPITYKNERAKAKSINASEFDNRFSQYLSEQERKNLGITKSTSTTTIPQWQYDLGVRPGMSDDQKNSILNSNRTITDSMTQMKSIFQQYKDAGWSQKDSEKKFAQENGYLDSNGNYTLPKAIQSLFDEVWK